ncbi:MAG: Verru_Chthon cassette protein C [Prosthecobacter sp.]|uniref:Verru_Chthon cassette protein C n=1 Tax=Prosthecobacter sp. TaxID=1965333 RepID=UPI0025DF1ACF|nr:Verru_Chthon cassette protein C [Prosthecobacter sp.]MCF7784691.1 Verru_Chthon cassette protein C [Prosthecobacter sp.]
MKLFAVSSRPPSLRRLRPGAGPAFTLIELLVSVTFLVILMLVVSQVIGIVQRSWVRANSRVSQFREARQAFDTLSRSITQATLNNYWDNEFDTLGSDAAGQQITLAKDYFRQSELQFICGPTSTVIPSAAGNSQNYPGHAVFFQAPLGIASLVATTGPGGNGQPVNTENMVNLLCGRGYFVEWGNDASFRPAFLEQLNNAVPVRSRLRLMEYSPTAEKNRIYDTSLRPITTHSKEWYQDVLNTEVQNAQETAKTRAFTRPIAENIIALVISPQVEVTGNTSVAPYAIAPQYIYDSTLKLNPGATPLNTSPQGTQHLLPPLLRVSMVALDERSGEFLAREENSQMRAQLLTAIAGKLQNAASLSEELDGSQGKVGTLVQLLLDQKLNYRIFSTTIALKQSRWSF